MISFGSDKTLAQRLRRAITKKEKLMFLVGSGLTSAIKDPYTPGVLNVNEIVEAIRKNLESDGSVEILDEELQKAQGENHYQVAMRTLLMCAGQDELNKTITSSVLAARLNTELTIQTEKIDQSALENDVDIWSIRKGVDALAKLHLLHKDVLSGPILTSNFDPLLEVAIRRNKGTSHTVFLTNDGSFNNILSSDSIQIVHFHGYWWGSDTLHTNDQITKERPMLKGALKRMLADYTLVVIGYGGWNDAFTRSLMEVAAEGITLKNILWTFYSNDEDYIQKKHNEIFSKFHGLINQRIVLYKGIDCDLLLPSLLPEIESTNIGQSQKERRVTFTQTESPPIVTTWSGRDLELEQLINSDHKVIFVTGIGGQGKTALVSYYLQAFFDYSKWELWDWRDCKEEANRLHTKLTVIIENLSNGRIRISDSSEESIESLVHMLFEQLGQRKIIFVFDNVDQYIDVERFQPTGSLEVLYRKILATPHQSQFVFTCRPGIKIDAGEIMLMPIKGLEIGETVFLFGKNGFNTLDPKMAKLIDDAQQLTDGHPLLLNLIIGQVKKNIDSGVQFITEIKENKNIHTGNIAEKTLKSVWSLLGTKQQSMLRSIAECIKPESEETLRNIMASELNSNQFTKSLSSLKLLNLIVVRIDESRGEYLDLHPLVKHFIRDKFGKNERSKYITLLVRYYNNVVVVIKKSLSTSTPLVVFEDWTSKIELEIAKEDYKSALVSLHEIHTPILAAGYHEEFLRISHKFFSTVNWRDAILGEYMYFHTLFTEFIELCVHMNREDVDSFLNKYVNLIPGKGVHYLRYCDLQCYRNWFTGNTEAAIEWGERGAYLKESSNIDSSIDFRHNLNLAYRDSRKHENIAKALRYFQEDADLEKALLLQEPEGQFFGTYFGNVGRCLEFLGDVSTAMRCYKKSFNFLQRSKEVDRFLNMGYACTWIGDITRKDNLEVSYKFYRYAFIIWDQRSYYRAQMVNQKLIEFSLDPKFDESLRKLTDEEIERFCTKFVKTSSN